MLHKVEYIGYLKEFSKRLSIILKKIDVNNLELEDDDREILEATLAAYIKTQKAN